MTMTGTRADLMPQPSKVIDARPDSATDIAAVAVADTLVAGSLVIEETLRT